MRGVRCRKLPADTQHGMAWRGMDKAGFCRQSADENSARTLDEVLAFYRRIGEDRASLGYDIDGVVYKIDRLDWQGNGSASCRAIRAGAGRAYKFARGGRRPRFSTAIDISGSGPHGLVHGPGWRRPCARFTVGGRRGCKNATLHNEDYIKGIGRPDGEQCARGGAISGSGDTVVIQRARRRDFRRWSTSLIGKAAEGRPREFHFPNKCPCPLHTKGGWREEETATGEEGSARPRLQRRVCLFRTRRSST